jgi:hypothetical protein
MRALAPVCVPRTQALSTRGGSQLPILARTQAPCFPARDPIRFNTFLRVGQWHFAGAGEMVKSFLRTEIEIHLMPYQMEPGKPIIIRLFHAVCG